MTLQPGTRLGHYEVVSRLGAGGMGEVYRASDTKLGREVALKILPPAVAHEQARMSRFEREAQLLASLNHPNVAALYGVEESGPALVMELVEGATLAERIARGPLPLDEALAIARQVCDALEAAHGKGIVHRDLKPANIKIAPEGQVKVLDFGLARALEGEDTAIATSATMSPTLTLAATRAGVILGTAAYMSPEQARGIPADKRADIWSFGVVLYEMLTGRMTFGGETVSDTMAAVLRADIDFTLLPADTPQRVRRLLRRCLERDRKRRLRDIGDARLELDSADEPPAVIADPTARRARWPVVAALALVPLVAGGAAGWFLRRPPASRPVPARFLLLPPTDSFAVAGHVVSPDGQKLILRLGTSRASGSGSLWLRDLDSPEYRQLLDSAPLDIAFSPDSRSIVFESHERIQRLDLHGGAPVTVCRVPEVRGISWNEQGVLLLGTADGIYRVAAAGGETSRVTTVDKAAGELGHSYPSFLPGGRWFLFSRERPNQQPLLSVADLHGKESPRGLMPVDLSQVLFAAAPSLDRGFLLFRRGESLMGVRFDARRRAVVSDAFPVIDRIPRTAVGNLAASVSVPARVMLASHGSNLYNDELVVLDRAGRRTSTLSPIGQPVWGHLEFSPDGKRLLGNHWNGPDRKGGDLWSFDLERGVPTRLTFSPGIEHVPAWSADGRRIFYVKGSRGAADIYAMPADGTGSPELLYKGPAHHLQGSPDGTRIIFESPGAPGFRLLSLDKPGETEVLAIGAQNVIWPQISPDGRWLAYASTESGRFEIYVQSFPPGRGKWQVSREGGHMARWRRDGNELVFVAPGSPPRFFSAEVRPKGSGLEFGIPALLFETMLTTRPGGSYFTMSADGKRFAMNLREARGSSGPLAVWLDWMDKFGR